MLCLEDVHLLSRGRRLSLSFGPLNAVDALLELGRHRDLGLLADIRLLGGSLLLHACERCFAFHADLIELGSKRRHVRGSCGLRRLGRLKLFSKGLLLGFPRALGGVELLLRPHLGDLSSLVPCGSNFAGGLLALLIKGHGRFRLHLRYRIGLVAGELLLKPGGDFVCSRLLPSLHTAIDFIEPFIGDRPVAERTDIANDVKMGGRLNGLGFEETGGCHTNPPPKYRT